MKFNYFNSNPDAQTFKSGKPKNWNRDDSCVRALCAATNKEWNEIFNELVNISKVEHDMPHSKEIMNHYCLLHNFTYHTFGKPAPGEKRPIVSEFTEKNSIGTYILYLRDYFVCIKDGVMLNTVNIENESIYSYWKLN